jgi:hypothetical protein
VVKAPAWTAREADDDGRRVAPADRGMAAARGSGVACRRDLRSG